MKDRKRRTKAKARGPQDDYVKLMTPNAAGIDLGAKEHWVAVPADRDSQPVRPFGCFTADLYAMAEWLEQCGVETVAMESTGVYWIPVFQVLETRGFEVKLVNAQHVKNVPGRKTDIVDCQWLQQLHSCGLLKGSFRPEDQMCVLRSYWRHRDNLIALASTHIQHMHKALEQMNIQLHKVISDVTGVTGMAIIRAILAGERDPVKLAQMKDRRIQSSVQKIAKALQGDYRVEHLLALQQSVELYDIYQEKIAACDERIEQCLAQFESRVDGDALQERAEAKPRRTPKGHQPDFDLGSHLYRITGMDYTAIPGLDVLTVQTLVSELGLDPSPFPSEKHFSSWAAISPNNRVTGGRVKSSRTRKSDNRVGRAFRLAAQSQARSPSWIGVFYRRIRKRRGAPKAVTATAHKLARIYYHMWTTGEPYQEMDADAYEQKHKERILNNMKKTAKRMGFNVILEPVNQPAVVLATG